MSTTTQDLQTIIKDQLAALPLVVQKAVRSSEIQANLRALSGAYKLHVDQWESLEEEVMMTLLGIDPIEDLQQNIVTEVGVDTETAARLTQDINKIIFEPIRQELERQLEHPDAREKEVSGVEAARQSALASAQPEAGSPEPIAKSGSATNDKPQATSPITPATPPSPAPDIKITRPSESTAYKPGETSAQRATVHDDPYREPPV
jgi:hypothetical protein